MKVAVVTANSRTSDGTQDFTFSGFGTPKAALFFWTVSQPLGTKVDDARISIGATDGTRQWGASAATTHALAAARTARHFNTDRLLTLVVTNATTPTAAIEADFSTWITDGVRINWTNASATARPVVVVLFGGADLTAYCGTQGLGTGTSAINVTTLGAAANIVFGATCGAAAGGPATNAIWSFGAGIPGGNQRATSYGSSHTSSPSVVNGKLYTDSIISRIISDAEGWKVALGTHASGFSLTPSASTSSADMGYLALAFTGGVAVNTLTFPTSGGSPWAQTWPGWRPQAVMLAPTFHTAVDSLETGAKGGAFGLSVSDGTTERSVNYSEQDAQTTTDCSSLTANKALRLDDDDGATAFDGSGLTFDATGFTIGTITTANGTQRYGWGVAFEEDVTVPPSASGIAINSAGTTATLTFNQSVTVGAGGNGGMTFSAATGNGTLTYASGSGSTSIVYTFSRTIYLGETVTLSYTQPGNGLEATSGGVDVATFAGQSTTNGSTQDSLSGNTSPIAATSRTVTLTSLLPSPSWSSDDTDVATVSGGVVTLIQAAGGVVSISDGGGSESIEFLPRVPTWTYGSTKGRPGSGQTLIVGVTLAGYGDGASIGAYPDVYPSCIAGTGVTFVGVSGTEPNYFLTFTTTAARPHTAIINGVERTITTAGGGFFLG